VSPTIVKAGKQPLTELAANRPDRTILGGVALIALATFIVYLPAIRGGFIWDDPDYILNNRTLRDLGGLWRIWTAPTSLPQWYPLVHTSFWIEYHLWQVRPAGYHIDNVLLHIGAALLVWRLLRKLAVPGAFLAAAIFALHPLNVESVAWVTERKNVLSLVLGLLALLSYLRYLDDPKRRGWYALALLAFIAALLSKTVVATLPAAIVVILWWKRGRVGMKDLLPLVPLLVLGIGLGLFTAYLESHHVGAGESYIPELNLSPAQRVLIAGRAVSFYAWKLVAPWPLVFIYPRWDVDPAVAWQWAFPVCVLAVLVALFLLRHRIGRAPLAAALLFIGTLFPALGFVNVFPMRYSFVADHFAYHASIPLIALIAAGLWLWGRGYALVALVPLALLTLMRTPVYTDVQTLWEDTEARNPDSWMVQMNLAHAYKQQAQRTGSIALNRQAEAHYLRAAELADNFETQLYAGYVYSERRNLDAALAAFRKSLEHNPNYAPAYFGVGQAYEREGDAAHAMENYQKALDITPMYPQANFRLARLLEDSNQLEAAAEHYRRAIAANPDDAGYRYSLGTVLVKLRQPTEAAAQLQASLAIEPRNPEAWVNLGAAQLLMNDRAAAARSYRNALQLRPGFPPAEDGLRRATQS
jgi:tetratricopeptide (TPR) repeat protein